MLQARNHFLRADLPEALPHPVPVAHHVFRPGRTGQPPVGIHEPLQLLFPVRRPDADGDNRIPVQAVDEILVFIQDECHAAGHSGCEVVANRAEQHHRAARHVLASIGATAFDDRFGAGITHREALTCLTVREEPACGRAIEHGIPDDYVLMLNQD